jgi:transcriptional regulator with XRE-family HTH domain
MKKESTVSGFGKRLAQLRKERGLTQKELADKVNVSRRIIVYYEVESNYPPNHLIVPLAKALNVTTEELLGIKESKETVDVRFSTLWRKLKVLETFSEKDRKAVLHYIDIISKKNKAEQKATVTK